MDYRWLTIFVTQIGLGIFLYTRGDAETAKLLWASALGQGVTANLKASKSR